MIMKYLMYENKVFKQSEYNETDFFSLISSDLYGLYFIVDIITPESDMFPETYQGTLCCFFSQNVILRNVSLCIVDDARELITKENVSEWLICVKQSDTVCHTRDIYLVDAMTDENDYYQTGYFAINLSDTPLGHLFNFGDAHAVDIMDFNKYKLYHKEETTNYHLVHKNI